MINGEGWLAGGKRCQLTVVPLKGWKREMLFAGTGRAWVPTSPHVPRGETSLFYAATGILGELGTINEGVGFPLPFELLGAPWIDGERFAAELNALKLPGVYFRPMSYKPFYGTHKGEMCGGVQIHLLDPRLAPWTAIQFYAAEVLHGLYPDHDIFATATPEGQAGFDKTMGESSTREYLRQGKPVKALLDSWRQDDEAFLKRRRQYLLYP
jgi:uncharacterized protein YbbC (DUF1343 family)